MLNLYKHLLVISFRQDSLNINAPCDNGCYYSVVNM